MFELSAQFFSMALLLHVFPHPSPPKKKNNNNNRKKTTTTSDTFKCVAARLLSSSLTDHAERRQCVLLHGRLLSHPPPTPPHIISGAKKQWEHKIGDHPRPFPGKGPALSLLHLSWVKHCGNFGILNASTPQTFWLEECTKFASSLCFRSNDAFWPYRSDHCTELHYRFAGCVAAILHHSSNLLGSIQAGTLYIFDRRDA